MRLSAKNATAPVKTAQAETTANDAPSTTSATIVPVPDYPPIADVTADIRKSIHRRKTGREKSAAADRADFRLHQPQRAQTLCAAGHDAGVRNARRIADDTKPFGTHVFTATATRDKGMKWIAVSLPVDAPKVNVERKASRSEREATRYGRNIARNTRPLPAAAAHQPAIPNAASVLDRIDIPKDAIARIEALMGPGASLVIADTGLGRKPAKAPISSC